MKTYLHQRYPDTRQAFIGFMLIIKATVNYIYAGLAINMRGKNRITFEAINLKRCILFLHTFKTMYMLYRKFTLLSFMVYRYIITCLTFLYCQINTSDQMVHVVLVINVMHTRIWSKLIILPYLQVSMITEIKLHIVRFEIHNMIMHNRTLKIKDSLYIQFNIDHCPGYH